MVRHGNGRVDRATPIPVLALRTDGGKEVGWGHVVRCLTLAEAWHRRGGRTCLLSARLDPALRRRATAMGVQVVDLPVAAGTPGDHDKTCKEVGRLEAEWCVLDGYAFGADYCRALGERCRVLFLNDSVPPHPPLGPHDAAWNVHSWGESRSRVFSRPWSFWGPRYALLSSAVTRHPRNRSRSGHGLVVAALGGGDQAEHWRRILPALRRRLPAHTDLQCVGLPPRLGGVQPSSGTPSVRSISVPCDLPEILSKADVLVTAAGGTVWEAAWLRLATVAVAIAENQRPNLHALAEREAAECFGWSDRYSAERVSDAAARLLRDPVRAGRLATRLGALVDGRGADRVVQRLMHESDASLPEITIRRMTADDQERVRAWRNSPDIMRTTLQKQPLTRAEQRRWFRSLDGNRHRFYVIQVNGNPAGVAHWKHLDRDEPEWGIYLGQKRYRNGRIARLVAYALHELVFNVWGRDRVCATILPDNDRSIRFHMSLGYRKSRVEPTGDIYLLNRRRFEASAHAFEDTSLGGACVDVADDAGIPPGLKTDAGRNAA